MILTGLARLGRDAVLRYSPDGTPVLNLALAYNYGQKAQDGNRPTQWVEAALWGKRAESLAPHLLKGTQLHVVIEDVRIETWQDKDGAGRVKLSGRLINLEFAGRAPERADPTPASAPARNANPPAQPAPVSSVAAQGGFDTLDDDIPF
jgi:single-strand DNA-binding protein